MKFKTELEYSFYVVASYNPHTKQWGFLRDEYMAVHYSTEIFHAKEFESYGMAYKWLKRSSKSKRCAFRKHFKVLRVERTFTPIEN